MKIVLDDISAKEKLYPFTSVRSVVDIRIGILTIREKWEKFLDQKVYISSEAGVTHEQQDNLVICPANLVPSPQYMDDIVSGKESSKAITLQFPWDIFQYNGQALTDDFELICKGRASQAIPAGNTVISPENIFIEAGAIVEHSLLNASEGPIYIGRNARIMEGCLIRGPFALCEGSLLKMGAKIYGATTLGPYCMGGGEIKNSVLFGYSNKAHDGYLGDSVIAEWCNLGAGTSVSNLKNTAGMVNVWAHDKQQFLPAGIKCGLLMGDYSRSAINTSFNTGTVAGICCNIFSSGFPAKYIPDFTWGQEEYNLDKALQDINNWKKLKNREITESEIKILTDIYFSQKIKHA